MRVPGQLEAHRDVRDRLEAHLEQDRLEALALALESPVFVAAVESGRCAAVIGQRLEAESVVLLGWAIWRGQALATSDVEEVVIASDSLDGRGVGHLLAQVLTGVLLDQR